MNTKRHRKAVFIGLILLLISSIVSLSVGRFTVSLSEVVSVFSNKIFGTDTQSRFVTIVWDMRFSRILTNILVGASLSTAGAVLQSVFNNKLVSPDILGISNGAGLGAVLAIFIFGSSHYSVGWMAFAFGMLSLGITYRIYKKGAEQSLLYLVLSGIIVGSMFSAIITLLKMVADVDSTLPSITYWLMGSFASSSFSKVFAIVIPISVGILVIYLLRWRVNILSLGDDEAKILGVNPQRTRFTLVFMATLITASAVSISGIIGWIGMVVPNVCREYIDGDNRSLIITSAIYGAIFMVVTDLISRSLFPTEIPIGVMMALIGGPLFILVYTKERK